jgi:hypothetical protein
MWLPLLIVSVGCRRDELPPPAVVVVVMDGVRPEESFEEGVAGATGESPVALLPRVWAEMVPRSARATQAFNLGATITPSAHAEMLTGSRVQHGLYQVAELDPGLYVPEVPGLFDARLDDGRSADGAVYVGNTELLVPLMSSIATGSLRSVGAVSFVAEEGDPYKPVQDDGLVASRLSAVLVDEPELVVVNLHEVDRVAHFGDAPDAYAVHVHLLDSILASLRDALAASERYRDNTWLFVLADHGRHDPGQDGSDPSWRNHGDGCAGCRHVPLMVLGPGVKTGQELDQPVSLADVAPTVGALLGLPIPFATGRVLDELFDAPPAGAAARTGPVDVVAAGGHTAMVMLGDDPERRLTLELDGSPWPTDALEVEAPSLVVVGGVAYACWKETRVSAEAGVVSDATVACASDDGSGWAEHPSPTTSHGPFGGVTLFERPDGLLGAAWVANLNGIAAEGMELGSVKTMVATWDGAAWFTSERQADESFPTDPVAVAFDGDVVVGTVAARVGYPSRTNRRLHLGVATGSGVDLALGPMIAWVPEIDVEEARFERPDLAVVDGVLSAAALVTTDDGTSVQVARASGVTLGAAEVWSGDGLVAPYVGPKWAGGRVVYATLGDSASVCASDGQDIACVGVDAPRIRDLAVDGDEVIVLVDRGVGAWEALTLPLP